MLPRHGAPAAAAQAPGPEPAPRWDLVEDLHGHRVADPYRWLEDVADPHTRRWREEQDRRSRGQLDALPGRGLLRERLTRLLGAGAVGAPVWRGGRGFWTRRDPGQEHPALWWRDGEGVARVLLDPMAVDPQGLTTLDGWSPSPDGRLLAHQLSTGGDEEPLLRVVEVSSGELVDGPISRTRFSPVAWLPDGRSFVYARRLPPGSVPAGEEAFHRRVYRHEVGTEPAQDVELWGQGLDPRTYFDCATSLDGRWLAVTGAVGTAPRNDIWLLDLLAGGPPTPVQTSTDAQTSVFFGPDDRLWLLTDAAAPRRRLCVATCSAPAHWDTVLPEDAAAVLTDVALVSGAVVAARTRHTLAEVTVHELDGRVRSVVQLPGAGTCTALSSDPAGGRDAWLGWTSPTTPPQALRLDGRTGALTRWQAPPGPDLPGLTTTALTCTSADGTDVRVLVLSDGALQGPRPAVLYGYGGFGIALLPEFRPQALAWVQSGGVYAVAGLRGGGEEGEAWHRAGMREHKPRVFEDLHAAADLLVDAGWTTRASLALSGGSNGGLLVGAALTQRPSAYAAVLCSAPLLDMARYELFGLGRTWSEEFGSASDPAELGWLLGYSPYHHVRDGEHYPAVLLTVFDGDSRVDPLHARKLCAALQHATASGRPVLLRDERGVGHGARSLTRSLELAVDSLAFLAAHTGLTVRPA